MGSTREEVGLRLARPGDAVGIVGVMRRVWPEEAVSLAHLVEVLKKGQRATLVAVQGDRIAGLVDCFETWTGAGRRRWEVDLLAVHPDFQGQGIGGRLVAAGTERGRAWGAVVARALVATDNVASQRTFARCGYCTDGVEHAVYLSTRPAVRHSELDARPGISVSTLRYNGLWVEEPWTIERLVAAQSVRQDESLDMVGAVISLDDIQGIRSAKQAGFKLVGHYHWWTVEWKDEG
ncbi:MAG: GNAT family N-acetyltransferase [Chloroflexota bacterium]|nr:GNAT family N-acetyltransferase [Chloroflexota bacterium]